MNKSTFETKYHQPIKGWEIESWQEQEGVKPSEPIKSKSGLLPGDTHFRYTTDDPLVIELLNAWHEIRGLGVITVSDGMFCDYTGEPIIRVVGYSDLCNLLGGYDW